MNTAKEQLRYQLADRQREKAELEQIVRGLQRRYRREVAPLEEKVLRGHVARLRAAAQANMRSARLRNAYHDAQEAYDTFKRQRSPAGSPDGMKAAYRRATKQCHPDVVPDAYHSQAVATFQSLEASYEAGHAAAVKAIATALDRWGFPGTTPGGDTDVGIDHLSDAVSGLEASIQALRATDAYQMVQEMGTLDAVVKARKGELARQLRTLRQSVSSRTK